MALLDDIRAEIARLETTQRRKGVVTCAMVHEAVPPRLRGMISVHQMKQIADSLNEALDAAADPVGVLPVDHQARAAGVER